MIGNHDHERNNDSNLVPNRNLMNCSKQKGVLKYQHIFGDFNRCKMPFLITLLRFLIFVFAFFNYNYFYFLVLTIHIHATVETQLGMMEKKILNVVSIFPHRNFGASCTHGKILHLRDHSCMFYQPNKFNFTLQ